MELLNTESIPPDVRLAAIKVGEYFKMQGIRKWKLFDIQSREEPREFWIDPITQKVFNRHEQGCIHVREVIEEKPFDIHTKLWVCPNCYITTDNDERSHMCKGSVFHLHERKP